MAELMRVPEVAAGATDAVLSEWLIEEGDSVEAGQPIAVIETDKALVEIEAESSAVVIKLLVENSQRVDIGAPMALLGTSDEATSDLDGLYASLGLTADASAVRPTSALVEVPATPQQSTAAVQDSAPPLHSAAVDRGVDEPEDGRRTGAGTGRQFISPIARRLIGEAGLDAEGILGTGPGGRVIRRDVEHAIATATTANEGGNGSAAPASSGDALTATSAAATVSGSLTLTTQPAPFGAQPVEIVEHSRVRRAVASRLTMSKQTIPHFYLQRTANIDALMRLRAELHEKIGRKLSVNDFVLRAVAQAHLDIPDANVIWTEDAIHRFDSVDIAVAVASDRGLVTPVLRSVERMGLGTISTEVKALVARANDGKLQQRELEGGTISVTNLGMYGVDEFSAIINPPHSAILAVGAGKRQPVVVDGRIDSAMVMSLVLSVDHRAIDGALAAQWLQALVDGLENPFRLLV